MVDDINIIKELYTILNKSYPILDIENKKPLAIGIHKELKQETGLSGKIIRRFLTWYCKPKNYRNLIIKDAERYNLKGEVVGVVSEEQAKHTMKLIQKKPKSKIEIVNNENTEIVKIETNQLTT